jgi:hypothetical protein
VYVSAVTESDRWPTREPINAQVSPCRCQRLIRRCRRSCGDQVGVPDALQARAIAVRSRSWVTPGEDGPVWETVLAWRERHDDCFEEVGREGDPASAPAFFDGAADAPAGVWFVEVAALEAFLLELTDAHAGCVEDEHGERVEPRHEAEDGLDLVGDGRGRFVPFFAREPNVDAVSGRVVLDAGEVEDLGEDGEALADGLAFSGRVVGGSDELGDVGSSDLVDAVGALILTKNEDGTIDATEFSDVEELGPLQALETQLADLLAAEDVAHLVAAMEPGSTAGGLIWENLWAAPFASAARRSGGELIADGRIPIQAIIASIEADEETATKGD